MHLNPSTLSESELYKLMSGAVSPRPIAWVSTVSKKGLFNLAPFSFFTVASSKPPMLCISIGSGEGDRNGIPKDTLTNIRDTYEFVVNFVPYNLIQEMEKSSKNYDPCIDEFIVAGVNKLKSTIVNPPGVKESPIQFECKLENIIPLGKDHLVIGKVVHICVQNESYQNGKLDLIKLQPVGRLAGNYTHIQNIFTL
ncbi:flavin reductase family protein [Neobacillus sp. CF12]|uniref:flavin reductase family protein n=1 Tax=Neobacillus sp. CF12 TaxID=3055864 RepID=UPI0025A041F4|nr:flavin reductase family protein [Neobacillus sp. CF12]MDM5326250.1 flavin reductase family protein [Neobacillus sp. CF12]